MKVIGILAASALAGAATLATAQPPAPASSAWLHVRVEEPAKPTKVNVNLPLSLVQVALEAAPEKITHHGQVHLHTGDHHLSVADLRKMWQSLKTTGDADFVQVEEKDETVAISRRGDKVQVRVKGKETVNVDVPVALVDALLSGEGQDLNLRAAMAQIEKLRGDVVNVQGKDATVRIWIDERN